MKNTLTLLLLVCTVSVLAQPNEILFNVFLKEKKIGQIKAAETRDGDKIIHDIQSTSDASVMMFSIHVETNMKIVKGKEVLVQGAAYRHANRGAEDVHAETKRLGSKNYSRERNGKKTIFTESEITFCISDLYFQEPKGLTKIYSNMFAEMVRVDELGKGKYQVTTPDKKKSIYHYEMGKLISVEMDTPGGKVTSKRI